MGLPFPVTGILDNFNRANQGPPASSSWTAAATFDAGLKVLSNRCQPAGPFVVGDAALWNPSSFGADQEAYFTLADRAGAAATFDVWVILRSESSSNISNCYAGGMSVIVGSNDEFIIVKQVGSVVTVLASFSIDRAYVAGDRIGLRIQGSTITAFFNGRVLGTVKDTTFADSGWTGLYINDANLGAKVDDFGGGNVPEFCPDPRTRQPEAADSSRARPAEADSARRRQPDCHNRYGG